jgi:hypothetical protein
LGQRRCNQGQHSGCSRIHLFNWQKPGSKLTRTAQIALNVAADGVQPIEVVLLLMRKAWANSDFKFAAEMAEVALPYDAAPGLNDDGVSREAPARGISLIPRRRVRAVPSGPVPHCQAPLKPQSQPKTSSMRFRIRCDVA